MILIYTLIICIFSILLENVAVDPIVRPAPSQQNGAGLSSFTMSMLAQQQHGQQVTEASSPEMWLRFGLSPEVGVVFNPIPY